MNKRNDEGGIILADAPKGEALVLPRESDSGLMIESVSIKNFRCFKEAKAEDLGLINVVVGDNASGKTAFLEALYFTATRSPQAHVKFLNWRGVAPERVGFSTESLHSGVFWADLFHWHQLEQPILISVKGSPSKELIIERYEEVDSVSTAGELVAGVRFGWSYDGGEVEYSTPVYSENDIKFPSVGRAIEGAMITGKVSPAELVQRWSDLDLDGRADEVLSIVNAEFPEIVGLSGQPSASTGNLLYAELRGRDRKIPLAHVSGGINRLVYILYNIAAYQGGSVYIDEFDVGVYHAHLGAVWSAIHRLARKKNNTQVFLSTHSAEALTALVPIIAEHEADFRLIRVSRSEGRSHLQVSQGVNLAAALETGVEVR